MPVIDLLTQYSINNAAGQNQANMINMYLEEEQTTQMSQYPNAGSKDPPKGKYKQTAYPSLGLVTFCDTGAGSVRALFELNEIVYAVAGNTFYRINSDGTKTSLATLNTSTGRVQSATITGAIDTNNQAVLIDGTNGYSYNTSTSVATFPIADVDFVQTATDITSQDEYVITLVNNSIQFYLSNLADTTTYEALDFASKLRKSDRVAGLISYKGELWLLGTKTTEVWQNTGNVGFPFERRSDVFIEVGCAAGKSKIVAGDRLWWLGKDAGGGYSFVMIQNYQPTNIATKPIMDALDNLTTVSDCFAITYAKGGHEFVVWTFPTDNKTFVYNISNGSWTVRSSYLSSTYGRFLGDCSTFGYGKSLIGDCNSGKIYYQDKNTYTENGVAIKRQIVTPYIYAGGNRIFISQLLIECQTNVGVGTFLLEMSTDGGITWESIETYTVGTSEAPSTQINTSSLGSAVSFVFRLTTYDAFKFVILGFSADYIIGEN